MHCQKKKTGDPLMAQSAETIRVSLPAHRYCVLITCIHIWRGGGSPLFYYKDNNSMYARSNIIFDLL